MTLAREELGLNPEDLGSPWGAALFSFFSFAAGASIPLVPFLIAAGTASLVSAIVATGVALFVVGATLLAFAILLRSATLSLIGLLPNLLGVGVVIATMGYVGVPLDIMTITIASISVGMGVDDAIHYLHRCEWCSVSA